MSHNILVWLQPKNAVRDDLGLILDMQGPVNDVAYHGTCDDQLRNPQTACCLRSVSRSLTQGAKFDPAVSRIDYCNVDFAVLPQRSIIRLQAVIDATARLVLRVKKFDHISTLMRDELQCLTIGERMRFKFSILVLPVV